MDLLSQIREGGILYILLLIAITMHEYGHALFADKLGDKLPRAEGRVTINPMAHIDTMGTVILPILTIALSMGSGFPMVFGWGKPVNVMLADPKTRARIDILSTMGGVSMNLVIALVSAILLAIFEILAMPDFSQIALTSIYLNCVLFVINMIPVPPLDGSVFLKYFSKISTETYYTIARWGIVILIALINIPFTSRIIMMLVKFLATIFLLIAGLIVEIIK
ncbi:MAG: site-2 protease family protein [Opitutales bacterium]|nr:site-2 protease family protein [Opitutales bacterium]